MEHKNYTVMNTPIFILLLFFSSAVFAQTYSGNQEDIDIILANIKAFSEDVMKGDAEALGMAYSEDAKIFPNNMDITHGRVAITNYWQMPKGVKIKYHKVIPEEIKVTEDEAYDYGYYEGTTLRPDGTESSWKGKYVIIWKKVNDDWKIYLDIWNSIPIESANDE